MLRFSHEANGGSFSGGESTTNQRFALLEDLRNLKKSLDVTVEADDPRDLPAIESLKKQIAVLNSKIYGE